jgi:hypothetical protein
VSRPSCQLEDELGEDFVHFSEVEGRAIETATAPFEHGVVLFVFWIVDDL